MIKMSVYLLLLCFIGGCSSNPKNWILGTKEIKSSKVSVQYGPTVGNKKKIFREAQKKWGLEGIKATNIYAIDFNSDGYTDIVTLPEHFSSPHFFQYSPKFRRFVKLSYDLFVEKNYCSFLIFADFNKDGIYDLVMGTHNQKTELSKHPIRVFKGKKNKGRVYYREIENAVPSKIYPTSSAVVIDYDLDGQLDIFLGNWYDRMGRSRKMSPDILLKGKGFSFKNATKVLGNEGKYSKSDREYPNALPTRGVSTCDLNDDGYPELMTAVSSGFPNKLWINSYSRKKGRIFINKGEETGYAHDSEGILDPRGGGNTFFTSCSDYNNDGHMDIIMGELSHAYDSETRDRSSILTGQYIEKVLTFIRSEYYSDDGTSNWTQADRRAGWFDYNLDGLIDIFVVNSWYPPKSRLIVFEQAEDHSYEDVAKKLGVDIVNPAGTVIVDVNRDGLMDLVTGQTKIRDASIRDHLFLFENNYKQKERRAIRFYPRGKKSNYHGLGATLIFTSTKKTQRRWVEYASGPVPSQNEEGILFGLEQGDSPKMLTVRWPILAKNGKPLIKHYQLKDLDFSKYVELTVCESGELLPGRTGKCLKK